jgi:hypothetical protein
MREDQLMVKSDKAKQSVKEAKAALLQLVSQISTGAPGTPETIGETVNQVVDKILDAATEELSNALTGMINTHIGSYNHTPRS